MGQVILIGHQFQELQRQERVYTLREQVLIQLLDVGLIIQLRVILEELLRVQVIPLQVNIVLLVEEKITPQVDVLQQFQVVISITH